MIVENYLQKILEFGRPVPKTFPYWRRPTKDEIKFGYGAIHHRDFDTEDCINKDGSFKLILKAENDGLKYYSARHEYYIAKKYKIHR